jgi:hypothetical protein
MTAKPKTTRKSLTGASLNDGLWDTFNGLQEGTTSVETAQALSGVAREMTRVIRTRAMILSQADAPIPADLLAFANGVA